MANLTIPQLVALSQRAGFVGDDAAVAAAIAMAESSGNPRADNPVSSATGLWQIMQSVHVKSHPSWSVAWLQVPENNAHAAYIVSNGGRNWTPWVVFTTGAYRKHLATARRALGSGASAPAQPATQSGAAGGPNLASQFDASSWLRIAMFLGGAALLLIVINKYTHLTSAIPVGRAIGAAKGALGK